MLTAIVTLAIQISGSRRQPWLPLASLLVGGGPVVLALVRVVPNAVRLGARSDATLQQSALARSICRDHLLCLIGILAFVSLQLVAAML
jgi:hypothetical protein